jgi:ABC-type glycerol-3-phosphate transport system substrate-binding protein
MILAMLAGCTNNPATSPTATSTTGVTTAPTTSSTIESTPDTREVVPITIMTLHSNYSDVDGIASDPVKAYIENKLKVKLSFVGGDNQQARLMITPGRAPDILSCFSWESGFTELMNDGIAQGMYINMNYYTSKDLDRYPILNKHFADKDFQMFNITYGGDASKCFVYFTMLKALRTMSTPIFNMQYLREANITTLPTTID